jgi:hypothetical protein
MSCSRCQPVSTIVSVSAAVFRKGTARREGAGCASIGPTFLTRFSNWTKSVTTNTNARRLPDTSGPLPVLRPYRGAMFWCGTYEFTALSCVWPKRMTPRIPAATDCSRNVGRAGHRHIVRSIVRRAVPSADEGRCGGVDAPRVSSNSGDNSVARASDGSAQEGARRQLVACATNGPGVRLSRMTPHYEVLTVALRHSPSQPARLLSREPTCRAPATRAAQNRAPATLQDHRVHNAEDCRVGADAERQGEGCDRRKARRLPEYARAMPKIGHELVERGRVERRDGHTSPLKAGLAAWTGMDTRFVAVSSHGMGKSATVTGMVVWARMVRNR